MANGTIAFDTLQTSGQITGTAKSLDTDYVVNGSAKAWVRFDSVVSTTSITNSFNKTSITDEGTGDTTVTITNNMSDGLYSMSGLCSDFHVADKDAAGIDPTSSQYRIVTFYVTALDGTRTFNAEDRTNVQIFGDLA